MTSNNLGLDPFSLPRRACSPVASADNLYGYLRSLALDTGDELVFDVGRFWSNSQLCLQAPGIRCAVAVYLLFPNRGSRDAFWQATRPSLAIDATVYASRVAAQQQGGGCSMVILFSCTSHLAGPLTYGEVLDAVWHYMGWCPASAEHVRVQPWTLPERTTIEMIPIWDAPGWFEDRAPAFHLWESLGEVSGRGFNAGGADEGKLEEES
ncbi:hypothetical protein CDD83_3016 [Cordyceps sp. RAO-2017]|nr:hypothetical protein CDD83_3016 [Cordyceps sp. RAO-2017]